MYKSVINVGFFGKACRTHETLFLSRVLKYKPTSWPMDCERIMFMAIQYTFCSNPKLVDKHYQLHQTDELKPSYPNTQNDIAALDPSRWQYLPGKCCYSISDYVNVSGMYYVMVYESQYFYQKVTSLMQCWLVVLLT